jgi:Ca2+-dependent lipid-binding protein
MSVTIKPISAQLLKDSDTIGKADPYVVLILGNEKQKGKYIKNAGLTPTWN